MNICFVVQRYGPDIAGGAEAACRSLATRLAERGEHVEVLTSCALSYVDRANPMPASSSIALPSVMVARQSGSRRCPSAC
jgi:hypothetical protein